MKRLCALAVVLSFVCVALAKDQPFQVIVWPEKGDAVLRFTFGKFKEIGSAGSERTYITDTVVENLWSKRIPEANFALYVFDKNKVRIAEANISVSNVGPGETIKFQTTIASSGSPVSLSVVPRYLPKELGPAAPARSVSITINTVPQGASAKLDGEDIGVTPKIARVTVGKHMLDFNKAGFNAGKFPFEIGPDDASGGSVSFELGTSAHDTIELRDGSVLSGDLVSISGMEVVIKVGGNNQSLNRNQVKRIVLVERETPATSNQ
jgi:hypothetical protein